MDRLERREIPYVQPSIWQRPDGDDWTTVSVELPLGDEWCAFAAFYETERGPVLAELRVFPRYEPGTIPGFGPAGDSYADEMGCWSESPESVGALRGSLSARLLRQLNVGEFERTMREALQPAPGAPQHVLDFNARVRRRIAAEAPRRVGRAGRPDRYYAEWAERYVRAIAWGHPNPIVVLAEESGLRPEQVRDLVHKARGRGLLTEGQRGRAGGALTDKGREALQPEGDDHHGVDS